MIAEIAFEDVAVGDAITTAWVRQGELTSVSGPLAVIARGDDWIEVVPGLVARQENMRYAFRISRGDLEETGAVIAKYTNFEQGGKE